MNCLNCTSKACKTAGKDCTGRQEQFLSCYKQSDVHQDFISADTLTSHGRAGTLNRLEEIREFCLARSFSRLGIAYCWGMENLAENVRDFLSAAGLRITSYRCTAGGVRENQIDDSLGTGVACNPAAQADAANRDKPDLIIEMGLCLGHDIIFHRLLRIPHTVLIVKDRVFSHNPAAALPDYRDPARTFIENIDDKFNMRTPQWLAEQLAASTPPRVVDLRPDTAFASGHIPGALNIPLTSLPQRWEEIGTREQVVVCVCNGSVQSAYALGLLAARGFKKLYNLSGGWGRWEKEERGVERGPAV
jgi:uncharacterized metal-binding protein/rhodanese-related sulfurtransferase